MDKILSIAAERRIGHSTVLTLSSRGRLAGQIEIATADVPEFKHLMAGEDPQIENVVKMLHRGESWEVINRITRCPVSKIEEISRIMRKLEEIREERVVYYFDEELTV